MVVNHTLNSIREVDEMRILGIRIGRSDSGKRRRKKAPTRLEKLYNTELLDAVLKSPKVLAVVIDKYGKLPASHEDYFEPITKNIRGEIYKKAVQAALKQRRRELVAYIDGIIDGVIGIGNSNRRQYRKEPAGDSGTGGQIRLQSSVYRRRPVGLGPEKSISLRTFLESLEIIAFLSKLASQQVKNGASGTGEIVYVVEQNGKPVELSERDYLDYALKEYLQQRKKKVAHILNPPRLPGVIDHQGTIKRPTEENEEGANRIEPQ